MNNENYYNQVKEFLEKKLGEEYQVELQVMDKLNGKKKEGFCIRYKGDDVSSIIYIEGIWESMDPMGKPEMCAEMIFKAYKSKGRRLLRKEICAEDIKNWERVRYKVYPFLMYREWNTDLIAHLVTEPFLDLEIGYYVRIGRMGQSDYGIVKIERGILKVWGISEEALRMQAFSNMEKDEYQTKDLLELLAGAVELAGADLPLGILTNGDQYYGAAGILNKKLLMKYANQMDSNLYLIPSSVNEILIFPDNKGGETKGLNRMIEEINREQVDLELRLSDHAYYYDREIGEITIAK